MKLTHVLSLIALPLGALATTPTLDQGVTFVRRDLATISSGAAAISASIKELDAAIKGFKSDAAPVTAAAKKLGQSVVGAIKAAGEKAESLSIIDVTALQPIGQSLLKEGEALLKSLKDKKAELEKAGACASLTSISKDILTEAEKALNALVDKLPEMIKATVKPGIPGIMKDVKEAADGWFKCGGGDKDKGGDHPTSKGPGGAHPTCNSGCKDKHTNKTEPHKEPPKTSKTLIPPTTIPFPSGGCSCPCACPSSAPPPPPPPPPPTTTPKAPTTPAPSIPIVTPPPAVNTTKPPGNQTTVTAGVPALGATGGHALGVGMFIAAVAALAL